MGIKELLIRTRYPVSAREKMRQRQDLVRLTNEDELQSFFCDLTSEEQFVVFDGVRFDTYYTGGQSALGRALLGFWYGLFERFSQVAPPGIYARIWLPRPVRADLRMVRRRQRDHDGGSFDGAFRISVSNREYFNAYLSDGFKQVLLRLSGRFAIRMDDECLRLGPLSGSPSSSAAAVNELIAVLPRGGDDTSVPPDFFTVAERDEEVTCVAWPANTLEADLVQSTLRSAGIPCSVLGYEQSRVWGNTYGFDIKVLVPTSFEEQAFAILEGGAPLPDEEDDGG